MSFSVPVVLLVFNRPEPVKQLLAALRQVKPSIIYVVSDGPRGGNDRDRQKNTKVKQIIETDIDWECTVIRDYSDINLGVEKRISSGLTKVFEQEERAIILEDDCIPSESFFKYCEVLLDKYQTESSVMSIGGNNFISDQ